MVGWYVEKVEFMSRGENDNENMNEEKLKLVNLGGVREIKNGRLPKPGEMVKNIDIAILICLK